MVTCDPSDMTILQTSQETARDFYRDLAPKVSKRIRWLVDELAEEEQRHFDLFNELMQRDDLHDQVRARIATPAADRRFSDHIHLPDLEIRTPIINHWLDETLGIVGP